MFSPPFKTSATTHAASLIIKQTLSLPLFLFQLAQTQTKTLVYEQKRIAVSGKCRNNHVFGGGDGGKK